MISRQQKRLNWATSLRNSANVVIEAKHARFDMSQDVCDNEVCPSTQFLPIQNNQLNDVHESLERSCKILPVFGFSSAKHDLHLIKTCLPSLLVHKRDSERTVIKKANQFFSFKFGHIQLLDIMNFFWRSNKS